MKTNKCMIARLMALCLTVVMVLSMTTLGAFAASTITSADQTGTITINGSVNDDGATATLYQIIDVNMEKVEGNVVQPKAPLYTWADAVASWLEEAGNEYGDYINDADNAVTEAFSKATASELSAFYQALTDEIKANITMANSLDKKDATLSDSTATVTGVPMGQHLVVASKGDHNYNPATATLYPQWDEDTSSWVLNDVTVALKGNITTIEKEANDTDVNIGDEVTYTVKASIPVYGPGAINTVFNVGDTMGTGLTWSDSVSVYWSADGENYTGNTVGDTYYDLATEDIDGATFEVQFKYEDLKTAYSAAKYVHVVYTAIVNEQAFEEDALGNKAYVGVSNNPYDENDSEDKTEVEEDVYTYGITVVLTGEGNVVLPGAQFKLYTDEKCETEVKFSGSDGVYLYDTNGDAVLTTYDGGKIQLQGLATGTYYLKEVKAPGSYQLPANPVVTVVMVDGNETEEADGVLDSNSAASGENGFVISTSLEENVLTVNLQNTKPGFELPTTGGMGTVAFTAGGLVIMACGAALVLYTMKKRKAED